MFIEIIEEDKESVNTEAEDWIQWNWTVTVKIEHWNDSKQVTEIQEEIQTLVVNHDGH